MTQDTENESTMQRLEARIARLEAQALAHAERLEEFGALEQRRKQRALLFRLLALVLLLGLLFWVKSRGAA